MDDCWDWYWWLSQRVTWFANICQIKLTRQPCLMLRRVQTHYPYPYSQNRGFGYCLVSIRLEQNSRRINPGSDNWTQKIETPVGLLVKWTRVLLHKVVGGVFEVLLFFWGAFLICLSMGLMLMLKLLLNQICNDKGGMYELVVTTNKFKFSRWSLKHNCFQ